MSGAEGSPQAGTVGHVTELGVGGVGILVCEDVELVLDLVYDLIFEGFRHERVEGEKVEIRGSGEQGTEGRMWTRQEKVWHGGGLARSGVGTRGPRGIAAEDKTPPYPGSGISRTTGAHDWGRSVSATSSPTCPVTPPPTPAMATVIAHPQDTPHPVVSPPLEATEVLPDKISAYYSLVFPNFTYYLQTLTVTIGRRCVPANTASTSDNPQVDVDLGPLKSVYRLHAKIEYDEDEERFVLLVIGRNGAWVDGVWSGSGSKVPLGDRCVRYFFISGPLSYSHAVYRSQIQIASRTFHFILPPPAPPEDSPSPSSQSSGNRARSPSVDITTYSPPSSLPSESPPPVHVPPAAPKIPPLPESALPNSNAIPHKANSKKRKKPDVPSPPLPAPEVMPPKPQLTYAQLCYRAVKALGGKASLQEICQWIKDTFDWYKYCSKDWEVGFLVLLSCSHVR